MRFLIATGVLGEFINFGKENAPLIGTAPSKNRPDLEEVAKKLWKGDVSALGKRIGHDFLTAGTMGFADTVLEWAMSDRTARDAERMLSQQAPPVASDIYNVGMGVIRATTNDSGQEKQIEAAKKGVLRPRVPGEAWTRGDVTEEQFLKTMREIFPQISMLSREIGARLFEDYRRQQLRDTMTSPRPGVMPKVRKGQERRREHLIELRTK